MKLRAVLVATSLFAVSCGGGTPSALSSTPSASPSQPAVTTPTPGYSTTTVASQPDGSIVVTMKAVRFVQSSLRASGGKVVFYLQNQEPAAAKDCPVASCYHNMVIKDPAGNVVAKSDYLAAGDARAFTVNNLAPGQYPFLCSVGLHADNGMTGTLTVS